MAHTMDWYLEWGYVLCASLARQTAAYFGASLPCQAPSGCPEYGAGSVSRWHPEQAGRCQVSLCALLQRCQQVTAISETLYIVASASA